MISRRKILSALLTVAVIATGIVAGPAKTIAANSGDGAAVFIADLGDRAIRTLSDTAVGDSSRRIQFRALFLEGFDVKALSRYAIGRYWRKADTDQRGEYQRLFTDFIVNTYAARFGQYSGERLVVIGERPIKGKDTIVKSNIVRPEGAPVRVDWRVRQRENGFKVIDIIVEGVSMAITQRDEFASVIRRNGGNVGGLIQELKDKTR
jgi:phospholipid transport system substrate-binding protein